MTRPPTDWPAVLFTHLVAVACCGVAGWFVHTQGSAALPTGDEWALLYDCLATDDLPRFAVKHHNEHRYPVGKLVWVTALRVSGYDFRAAGYVSVGLLTAAAVLLLWTARGVRGRAHPADALLPVLLLNLGHSFNLLMSYQVGFAGFAYGMAGWVWCAGRLSRGGGWGWAVLAGVYGTLVVQSGGLGQVFTPLLAAWCGLAAVRRVRGAALLIAFASAWVAYSGWVWATAPASFAPPPARTPDTTLGAAVGFLSTGFGGWPITGEWGPRWAGGAAAVAAYLIGFAAVWRGWRWPDPLTAALGVTLVGVLVLGAAAAYARGYGLAGRFVTPSAVGPAACWLAVAGGRFRIPAWVGWTVGPAAAGVLYWANVDPGLRDGYYSRLVLGDMRTDLTGGMPPVFLAGKYGGTVPVLLGDDTADFLRAYQRTGVGVFRHVAADPTFDVTPVPGVAVPFVFEGTSAVVTFPDPPRPVLGLRLLVDNHIPAGWQRVWLRWRDADTGAAGSAWAYPPWVENRMHLTFPLTGRPLAIRAVRLVADDGVVQPFAVEAVEWMVPK